MTPISPLPLQTRRRIATTRPASPRWPTHALLAAVLVACAGQAHAHELDSASLLLRETSDGGRFVVRWRATSPTWQRDLRAAARFPEGCQLRGDHLDCRSAGLVGVIAFPGLEGTLARVLVSVEWRDGPPLTRVLTASTPEVKVYGGPASGLRALWPVLVDYLWLGVEHILTGFDHLLFVVALILLVGAGSGARRSLLMTVTAFTLAHSASLAATILGLVQVPTAPVEASIALSILLVCSECLRAGGPPSLAKRAPWMVAFPFGLLHGLGFASALLDVGVPESHVASALVAFNVGVELGQLGVIAVVLALQAAAARTGTHRPWMRPTAVYAMGGLAAFWFLDRLAPLLGARLP